jgi:hypothetical protein
MNSDRQAALPASAKADAGKAAPNARALWPGPPGNRPAPKGAARSKRFKWRLRRSTSLFLQRSQCLQLRLPASDRGQINERGRRGTVKRFVGAGLVWPVPLPRVSAPLGVGVKSSACHCSGRDFEIERGRDLRQRSRPRERNEHEERNIGLVCVQRIRRCGDRDAGIQGRHYHAGFCGPGFCRNSKRTRGRSPRRAKSVRQRFKGAPHRCLAPRRAFRRCTET